MLTFGQILRQKRKAKGWTLRKFAELLGVNINTVNRWELGLTLPNIYNALDIATLFGCSIDELVGRGEFQK